jgi:hypothetical protein
MSQDERAKKAIENMTVLIEKAIVDGLTSKEIAIEVYEKILDPIIFDLRDEFTRLAYTRQLPN